MSPMPRHGRGANILADNDYAVYQVPEVWLLKRDTALEALRDRLVIYEFQEGSYQERSTSRYFPEIDLQVLIAECSEAAKERGTGVAIRELRSRLTSAN